MSYWGCENSAIVWQRQNCFDWRFGKQNKDSEVKEQAKESWEFLASTPAYPRVKIFALKFYNLSIQAVCSCVLSHEHIHSWKKIGHKCGPSERIVRGHKTPRTNRLNCGILMHILWPRNCRHNYATFPRWGTYGFMGSMIFTQLFIFIYLALENLQLFYISKHK